MDGIEVQPNSKLPHAMVGTVILLQLKNCMPSGHFSPNILLITLFYFQIPYSLFPVAFINSLYTWEYYYLYIASFLSEYKGILDKREKDRYLLRIFYNLECMHIYVKLNFFTVDRDHTIMVIFARYFTMNTKMISNLKLIMMMN